MSRSRRILQVFAVYVGLFLVSPTGALAAGFSMRELGDQPFGGLILWAIVLVTGILVLVALMQVTRAVTKGRLIAALVIPMVIAIPLYLATNTEKFTESTNKMTDKIIDDQMGKDTILGGGDSAVDGRR